MSRTALLAIASLAFAWPALPAAASAAGSGPSAPGGVSRAADADAEGDAGQEPDETAGKDKGGKDKGATAKDKGGKDKGGKDKKPGKGNGKGNGKEPATPAPVLDGDSDGTPDDADKCPAEAEDRDRFEDSDGCPDPDNDGDKIPDTDDECPDKAENVDGMDDEDGCPEPPPKIQPIDASFELNNGAVVKGRVLRIVAVDEDEPDSKPVESDSFTVILEDESEWPTGWDNVLAMKSEKVKFTEAVDCYSEGSEMGESTVWECTLKHPTVVTLAETDARSKHLFIDSTLSRLDFKFAAEGLTCTGTGCEEILSTRVLPLYLYKLIAFETNDDESAAVASLQTRLRDLQTRQIKTATFKPVPK